MFARLDLYSWAEENRNIYYECFYIWIYILCSVCRAPYPYFEWSLIACHTLIHYRCACVYIFGELFVFIFILFILISSKLLELVGMGMGVLASNPTDVYCGCHIFFSMVGTYRFQFHSTNQVSYTCCISISTVLYRLIWNGTHTKQIPVSKWICVFKQKNFIRFY